MSNLIVYIAKPCGCREQKGTSRPRTQSPNYPPFFVQCCAFLFRIQCVVLLLLRHEQSFCDIASVYGKHACRENAVAENEFISYAPMRQSTKRVCNRCVNPSWLYYKTS